MARRLAMAAAVLAAVPVLCISGCGGGGELAGGGGGSPAAGGETITIGSLQVGVDSAAGFKMLTLPVPPSSPTAFIVLHGSKIIRLENLGYGKIAFRSSRDGNYEIYVMNADGSGQTNISNNAATDA